MESLERGLGTRHAYFEKGQKTRDILSKSSFRDLESSDRDKFWPQDQYLMKEPRDLG